MLRILKAVTVTCTAGPAALHNTILRNPATKAAAVQAARSLHLRVHPDKNPAHLSDKANTATKLLNAAKAWAEAHLP